MDTFAERLRSAFPGAIDPLDCLARARQAALRAPLEPFYEPVSVIEESGKSARLVSLTLEAIKAWMRHVSCATRVRLSSLQVSVLSELCERRLLPAMVLTRAHLEAAGFACLAEKTLLEAFETGDSEPLRRLIPKMLLGTSMRHRAQKDELIADFLTFGEQSTIRASEAVAAMGHFLGEEISKGFLRQYALLCEFSHPNPRGVRGFSRVLNEDDEGWLIGYEYAEEFTEEHVIMCLELLSQTARVGFAAAEALRVMDFSTEAEGSMLVPPSEEVLRMIWAEMLQGEEETPGHRA